MWTVEYPSIAPWKRGALLGSSDEGYHWNWSAENCYHIGDSMGKATMSVLPSLSSANQILTFGILNQTQGIIAGTKITLTVTSGFNLTNISL